MLFAELHGKLGRDGSRAHDRAEDLLTSTAFQLLRYLPPRDGLFAVLNRVRAVRLDGSSAVVDNQRPAWLSELDRATSYDLDFWRQWGVGVGQPELIVTLKCQEKPLARILIEVKLDSGKSQLGDVPEEPTKVDAGTRSADQLFRYWQHLAGLNGQANLPRGGLVYLTSHVVPPLDDLTKSLRQQPKTEWCDWLGWLSWRDVWAEMQLASTQYLAAEDLAAILGAKGLKGFDGLHARLHTTIPSSGRFWASVPTRWFCMPPVSVPNTSHFWSGNKEKT